MIYLYFILGSGLILVGFLLLSVAETSRGIRLLPGIRRRLDTFVGRGTFIITHIDWGAFFAYMLKTVGERIAHDIVHSTLLAVRAVERTLTRIIRELRIRIATHEPLTEASDESSGGRIRKTVRALRKTFRRDPQVSTETLSDGSVEK